MNSLAGRKVAILATDGFEQVELTEPKKALEKAGAEVDVVAPKDGFIQGFRHFEKGDAIGVTKTIDGANPNDYDALVIPGGVFNPDQLRIDENAKAFTQAVFGAGKTVAAICHAPWLLIDAGLVEGKTMTGYKTVRTDLANAGAQVIDEGVVVDGNLVTSRGPDDLPAFCEKLVEMVAGEPENAGKGWAII